MSKCGVRAAPSEQGRGTDTWHGVVGQTYDVMGRLITSGVEAVAGGWRVAGLGLIGAGDRWNAAKRGPCTGILTRLGEMGVTTLR